MAVRSATHIALACVFAAGLTCLSQQAQACPFCTAVGPTFAEEMASADAVVLARPQAGPSADKDRLTRMWRVEKILKGQAPEAITAPRLGETSAVHYIVGRKVEGKLEWSLPLETTPELAEYLAAVAARAAETKERLQFFQQYLEHTDRLIADDAYNEFGKAPYADVRALKPHMDREKLLQWVGDSDITFVRRKLYLTMLGVCGTKEDAAVVQALVESPRPSHRNALDAAIACYIALAGEAGLTYVEEKFLRPAGRDTSLMVSGIAALRFHGEELREIPRPRLAQSLAVVLDHPPAADLVLADLARWGDWSHVARLAEMFENCAEDARHIRAPIARYLLACPDPTAAAQVARLREIDAASVKQAEGIMRLRKAPAAAEGAVAERPAEAEAEVALPPAPQAVEPGVTTASSPVAEPAVAAESTNVHAAATSDPARSETGLDLMSTLGGLIAMGIAGVFAMRLR